eukprot:CAMPEP_0197685968 /NCGR_PEP_ID=MMETSP1338-20131121/101783_1 /TAXON_ID=43686 ORGANISM="Pelagodinium beii, Strain RCC1491" /NCGR_SAMPLE_ID=MMETSP1338 /ASSEMBLY_ACC=CAM_ASM_000754 /LENGTH=70 /DNA_ID=CAMNT_0043267855 /DNA_START=1 /DNA_END=209 /DNA_ORIENTATION=-
MPRSSTSQSVESQLGMPPRSPSAVAMQGHLFGSRASECSQPSEGLPTDRANPGAPSALQELLAARGYEDP